MQQEPLRHHTRDRLLEAACKRFSEKGYRATRTQDICRDANANMAAVNYHFGGKAALYKAVWDYALQQAEQQEKEHLPASSSEDREWIYKYVHTCVTSIFGDGMEGMLRRLVVHEFSDPSPFGKEILLRHITPHAEELSFRLHRMLGERATDYQIGCCVFAIQSLFTSLSFNRSSVHVIFRNAKPAAAEVDQFVREICAFIMGGIHSIRPIPRTRIEPIKNG